MLWMGHKRIDETMLYVHSSPGIAVDAGGVYWPCRPIAAGSTPRAPPCDTSEYGADGVAPVAARATIGVGATALLSRTAMNRRRFLHGATITSGMVLTAKVLGAPLPARAGAAGAVPRVCSTWD